MKMKDFLFYKKYNCSKVIFYINSHSITWNFNLKTTIIKKCSDSGLQITVFHYNHVWCIWNTHMYLTSAFTWLRQTKTVRLSSARDDKPNEQQVQ